MKVTTASFDSLYIGVINTIINVMNENNVKTIPMKDNKVFGNCYDDIFLNENNELGYHFSVGNKTYTIYFKTDKKDWHLTIHRFDLPELLKEIVFYLNDNITEEI